MRTVELTLGASKISCGCNVRETRPMVIFWNIVMVWRAILVKATKMALCAVSEVVRVQSGYSMPFYVKDKCSFCIPVCYRRGRPGVQAGPSRAKECLWVKVDIEIAQVHI